MEFIATSRLLVRLFSVYSSAGLYNVCWNTVIYMCVFSRLINMGLGAVSKPRSLWKQQSILLYPPRSLGRIYFQKFGQIP